MCTCQCMRLCAHVCGMLVQGHTAAEEPGSPHSMCGAVRGGRGPAGRDRSWRARRPGWSPEEPRQGLGGREPGRAQAGSHRGPSALAPGLVPTPPLGHTQRPDLPWALSLPAKGEGLGQALGADPSAGGRAVGGHFSPEFSQGDCLPTPQTTGCWSGDGRPHIPAWVTAAFLGHGPSWAPGDSSQLAPKLPRDPAPPATSSGPSFPRCSEVLPGVWPASLRPASAPPLPQGLSQPAGRPGATAGGRRRKERGDSGGGGPERASHTG